MRAARKKKKKWRITDRGEGHGAKNVGAGFSGWRVTEVEQGT